MILQTCTAHIKMKNKKGLFGFAMPILLIFFAILVLLVLIIIFKDRLVSLVESFTGLLKGPKIWIGITLVLVIVFRKFVLEVLMMILKLVRGILKI